MTWLPDCCDDGGAPFARLIAGTQAVPLPCRLQRTHRCSSQRGAPLLGWH